MPTNLKAKKKVSLQELFASYSVPKLEYIYSLVKIELTNRYIQEKKIKVKPWVAKRIPGSPRRINPSQDTTGK